MMLDFLSQNAGMVGLLFFFTFFLAVLAFVCRPGAKEKFRDHARIPLEENE